MVRQELIHNTKSHKMPSLVAEACSVLGIEAGKTGVPDEEVVAAAFKKLAIRWHPDRNPDNVKEATQRFAEISAARDLLLDPPTNALLDEPTNRPGSSGMGAASGEPYPKTAHSKSMRAFEDDVTESIASGELGGKEAVALFESFGLWAVWKCDMCEAVCCRIRKNKYSCMCGHRLREHDAGNKFRCGDLKCPCKKYEFMVQDTDQPHKCRCKHGPKDHDPEPPYACQKCDCAAFDSPWTCNCGHAPRDHRTSFVKKAYTERCREWVAGGLRGECVAMAKKFRSRSVAERVSFIQRANAAKAAGFPSWKAMQREAQAHTKYGTEPTPPPQPHAGGRASDVSHATEAGGPSGPCGECDPSDDTRAGSWPGPSSASEVGFGMGLGGSATQTPEQRAAATRAGFRPGNETSHGLTTEELRERLAAAGVGVRPANAADFGAPGLW